MVEPTWRNVMRRHPELRATPAAPEAGTSENPLSTPTPSTYVSDEATAALLLAHGLTVDVIHKQTFGDFALIIRHVSDPENYKDGTRYSAELDGAEPAAASLTFQHGNPFGGVINGWTNEALLAVLIHRIRAVDALVPCLENKNAIEHMQSALWYFNKRTAKREARGVVGTTEA